MANPTPPKNSVSEKKIRQHIGGFGTIQLKAATFHPKVQRCTIKLAITSGDPAALKVVADAANSLKIVKRVVTSARDNTVELVIGVQGILVSFDLTHPSMVDLTAAMEGRTKRATKLG